ncbi:MAG: HDIG domain-containing protein [Euzebyales bacterium]|nr:HDIG domain-containing protein [Euzebyales bacterium]
MANWSKPRWLPRSLAAALVLLGVPLVLSVSAFLQDAPIRPGEPSPRTVIAPDLIRVDDPEATERARREAAAAVTPVLVDVEDARVAIPQTVRDAFTAAVEVRAEGEDDDAEPLQSEQIAGLRDRLPMLTTTGLRLLTGQSESELRRTADQAEDVAREFAQDRITDEDLDDFRGDRLRSALSLRSWAEGVEAEVVEPIIADALRPTVQVDAAATEAEREEAASSVQEVGRTFTRGQAIVVAGQEVEPLQFAALQARGLEGAVPWLVLLSTMGLLAALLLVVAAYLRVYRPDDWASTRKVFLLAVLATLYAISLEAVILLAPTTQTVWLFLVPVGAMAMLATILFDPPIAVLLTIPATAIVAFTVPGDPGLVTFVALASLASVPLVSRLSARGDLRKAAVRSTVGYAVLAAVCAAVFDGVDSSILWAAGVGALNGVLTAVIVNGSLPFLESTFGILTATSLLDLADRNHPLLRELEQKALGTYNHSIMVSTMVERACRAIGADGLLGSVAALYHDIGKVRRPYFFVENQFAIDNPHDSLEPPASAVIIQEHVPDGVEMATTSRMPPEVVEGIATHHGTTLVSYFYRRAVEEAGDAGEVDESHYRYKGRKPTSAELAVLMLADCCESASRAAALQDRNLSKADLEDIVHGLVADRVEDGQLDDAALTFRQLKTVQESFIETLVGVYHPRIAYPKAPGGQGERQREQVAPTLSQPAPPTLSPGIAPAALSNGADTARRDDVSADSGHRDGNTPDGARRPTSTPRQAGPRP